MPDALRQAALDLYLAGRWSLPFVDLSPSEQGRLWEALRDALNLPEGTATRLGL